MEPGRFGQTTLRHVDEQIRAGIQSSVSGSRLRLQHQAGLLVTECRRHDVDRTAEQRLDQRIAALRPFVQVIHELVQLAQPVLVGRDAGRRVPVFDKTVGPSSSGHHVDRATQRGFGPAQTWRILTGNEIASDHGIRSGCVREE